MKKILVLDIDGTCITDSYNVTDELRSLIHEINKKHMVYIATGRSVSDAYRYYKEFNLNNNIICHNGGLVLNPKSGVVRFKKEIKNADKLLSFLVTKSQTYGIDNIVLSRCNETYLMTNINPFLHEIIIHEELPYFYVGENIKKIHDVQRIIISVDPKYRHILQDTIIRLFDDIIVCGWRGREDIIDISVGSVNKWDAVKIIAEEKKICAEDIISFGDSSTDIEMLYNSGVGVCMCNGTRGAIEAANYVTEFDNNGNGVYHFLVNRLAKTLSI